MASSAGSTSDVDRLETFQTIYLADALSYLPALFLLLVPLRHVAGRVEVDARRPRSEGRTLEVFRRPAMASLTLLGFVSSFVGYSQLNAGMPAYARAVGEVSTLHARAARSPPTPW